MRERFYGNLVPPGVGKNSSQCLSHLSFVMQKVGTQFIFEYGSG